MLVSATTLDAYNLLHKGSLVLAAAERQGIHVDLEYCERTSKQLARRIKHKDRQLTDTEFARKWKSVFPDFNYQSDPQLRHMVYTILKKKVLHTTDKGLPSVNFEALSAMNVPEIDQILELRKLAKITTYLEGFQREQVDGIIHPFFNLNLLVTYRSSSSDPNFQNIPNRDQEAMNLVRGAMIPSPGNMILGIDFGGIEVRVACCYHKDPQMIKYINDPTTDMHRDMAMQIYKLKSFDKQCFGEKTLRNGAKNGFVFPEFYGSYWAQCAPSLLKWTNGVVLQNGTAIQDHLKSVGLETTDKFEQHIKQIEQDFWTNRFPVYDAWRKQRITEYERDGYFDMFTGFRCQGQMRKNQVVNYPVQGAAFHCLLKSMIEIDRILQENGFRTRIMGQIHDEIVFDLYPPELHDVMEISQFVMTKWLVQEWPWIITPMEVEATASEVDASWNKKKVVKQYPSVKCQCGNDYVFKLVKEEVENYYCPVCRKELIQ